MVSDSAARLQFLTIVTFGRSGSTALQAALNAHPDTIIRGENYAALRGIQAYVESIAAAADRHHAGKPEHPWFGTARLDPAAVLADQRRHVIEYLLRPKPTTRWTGFKEVRYEVGHFPDADSLVHHLLFLNTLLPGMRYLVNVRDPALASTSGWWSQHPDALSALQHTVENLRAVTEALREILGSGRVALIDHDQWVADPRIVVGALTEVGFPVDVDIVRAALAQRLTHGKGPES
jgi:hypothetical protein